MSRVGGGAAEWLSQSDFASELVSSLGRALGGGSPVSAPRKPKPRTPAAAPSPLRPPAGAADAPPHTPPPTPPPLSPPAALTRPPSPAPAPPSPSPLPSLLSPLSLLSRRPSDPALSAPATAPLLPPPAPAPPAARSSAAWDGLGDWDVTKLLPADKRESLHAAAAAFRAGLPGGGNPSALLGTALLGTTDGALRGFAGLMGSGGSARRSPSAGGARARR
jgi:hypothetical protein